MAFSSAAGGVWHCCSSCSGERAAATSTTTGSPFSSFMTLTAPSELSVAAPPDDRASLLWPGGGGSANALAGDLAALPALALFWLVGSPPPPGTGMPSAPAARGGWPWRGCPLSAARICPS
eukprot:9249600-Pyramimonas_sp.AAC.1